MNKWALAVCIIALLAVLASAETEQHGAQQTRVSSLTQGGGLGAKIKGLFNKMLGFALKEAKTAMAKLGSKTKATFVLRGTSPAVIPGSSIDSPDRKLKAALKGVTLAASVVPEWDDAATDKHKAMIKLANEFSGPFAMLADVKKNPIKGIAKGAAKQAKNAAKGKAPIPCVFVVLALKHKKSAGGHGASPPPAPPKGAPAAAPKRAGAAKKKLFMLLEQAAFIKAVRVHRAAVTLQAGGEGEGEPEQHHDDAAAASPPAEGAAPPPAAEGTPDAAAAPAAAEGAPDAAAPAAAEGAPDAAAAAEPSTPEEKAEAAEEEHALTEVDSAFPEPKADEIAKETEPLPEGAKPTKLKGLIIPNLWVFGVEKGKFQILAKAGSINLGKSKHKGGKGKHKKGGKHDDKHGKHDKGAAHHEGDAGKPHDKKKKKKFM